MKLSIKLLLSVFSILFLISCEADKPVLGSTDAESAAMQSLSKGKGGGNAGETAYTCASDGEWTGFNETGNPDYSVYSYTLWAGQHNEAGTVTITNDDVNLYVTYNTNETADLGEVHVYVWDDSTQIPTKRPAPGHADFVVENINADQVTVTIPRDINCGDEFYISTHAALVGNNTDGDEPGIGDNSGETAYGGNGESPSCYEGQKGAWWGFVAFPVECFYDISGTLYEDGDNSGDLEAGESGFEGLTVTLLDSEGNVLETTTTAADGSYLFEHVAGGADYTVITEAPAGDYLANENAGGYSITGLSADLTDVDFGFVPLYDLSVSLTLDGDMDCFAYSTVTINGVEVSSLENQLPGFYYDVVVTAYDFDGNVLASEMVSNELYEDTVLSLTLGGWVCPAPPVDDCNDCLDGELVVNGSFEDGFSGWVSNFGHSTEGYPIDRGDFYATDGTYGIDLIGTGPSAPGFVEQTLCTEIGEEYVLSFDLLLVGAGPALVVIIDGVSQTVSTSGTQTVAFTANATSTTIRLSANAYFDYLSNNVLIDDVSVACGDDVFNNNNNNNDNDCELSDASANRSGFGTEYGTFQPYFIAGSVKFEDNFGLGEDGAVETVNFTLSASSSVVSVDVATKSGNQDESDTVYSYETVGDSYTDAGGFTVTLLSIDNGAYTFSVTSDNSENTAALSHISFYPNCQ